MKFFVGMHNWPLRWEVEAENSAEALQKGMEAIKSDMDAESLAHGGHYVIKEQIPG